MASIKALWTEQDITKYVTVTVTVRISKMYTFRLWLAKSLIHLGVWIAGLNYKEEVV